jgi:PDZ domain-containing secreted protein
MKKGDELISIDGKKVVDAPSVLVILQAAGVGAKVTVRIARNKAITDVPMTLFPQKKVLSLDLEGVDAVLERKISP